MTTPPTHAETEARLRGLLEEEGLPQPDEVEHRPGEVLFLYHEQKLAIAIDLEERRPVDGEADQPPISGSPRSCAS